MSSLAVLNRFHSQTAKIFEYTSIPFTPSFDRMVQLKPSPSTIAQPKPRYGHLSKIHPEFEPLKETIDKRFTALWSLPLDDLKTAYRTAPVAFPEGVPQAGKEYQVSDQEIPMRDGAKIGLRVYRPIKTKENAMLVLKAHGGGIFFLCCHYDRPLLTFLIQVGSLEVTRSKKSRIACWLRIAVLWLLVSTIEWRRSINFPMLLTTASTP